MRFRFFLCASVIALAAMLAVSCNTPRNEKKILRMATTTSTENSGLLDVILPVFEEKTGIKVEVIAVGTGKALMLGENGDVDVLMVHAPDAEKKFMEAGFGTERTEIMYNDFIIMGPRSDPAGISGMKSAIKAFKEISIKETLFISRGDDSGTHKKEISLMAASDVNTNQYWYMEIGRGMGATLIMADEKQAYTLADRGTYLSMADKLTIIPLVEGDPELYNVYSVIPVSPEKHPDAKIDLAEQFLEWITSPEARELISGFRINGEQLFHPLPEKKN